MLKRIEIKELQGTFKRDGHTYAMLRCPDCGSVRSVRLAGVKSNIKRDRYTGRCFPCSHKRVLLEMKRAKNLTSWGYANVYLPKDSPYYPMVNRDGVVREHRFVMAQHLGRCLTSDEHVHHKNGIKTDNRIENLEIVRNGEHIREHQKGYNEGFNRGYEDGKRECKKAILDKLEPLEHPVSGKIIGASLILTKEEYQQLRENK